MLGVVSAQIRRSARSNLEQRLSYKALLDDVVQLSATTLSNIYWREYVLTVDAIKKQLPSQNKVSLALDGWTSMNTLGITSVISYDIDRQWALPEVPLAFDKVNQLFCCRIES
jgi:hypothetical protein